MRYEEVGHGGDASLPFISLVRSMWDGPSAIACTRSRQPEVVASCCSLFATLARLCQWSWKDASPAGLQLQIPEMVLVSREVSKTGVHA